MRETSLDDIILETVTSMVDKLKTDDCKRTRADLNLLHNIYVSGHYTPQDCLPRLKEHVETYFTADHKPGPQLENPHPSCGSIGYAVLAGTATSLLTGSILLGIGVNLALYYTLEGPRIKQSFKAIPSKAYLNAKTQADVYLSLPDEQWLESLERNKGRLTELLKSY